MKRPTFLLAAVVVMVALFATPPPAQAQAWTRTSASYLSDYATAHMAPLSANGASAVFDTLTVVRIHAVYYVVTGAPTAGSMLAECSMLTTGPWQSLGSTTVTTSIVSTPATDKPCRFVRLTLSALAGGTAPTVAADYVGTR